MATQTGRNGDTVSHMTTRKRGDAFATYLGGQVAGDARARGITVKDLAAKMGIDRSQLDRYLKGTRPMPTSVLSWAAEAMGEDPHAIVKRAYDRFIKDYGHPANTATVHALRPMSEGATTVQEYEAAKDHRHGPLAEQDGHIED
ncbi:Transcriptional regulator, contains XRE-family HTH domain [Micrococcales bacterium KH10]|nr:Transcriptional regulator, contains XRE-family HTH domain [Micrococcales bacterium KH10]